MLWKLLNSGIGHAQATHRTKPEKVGAAAVNAICERGVKASAVSSSSALLTP